MFLVSKAVKDLAPVVPLMCPAYCELSCNGACVSWCKGTAK